MDGTGRDVRAFFGGHQGAYPAFELLCHELNARFPQVERRVQKTQISFYNRRLFACVSFLRPRRRDELPEDYLTLTLGLARPLESARVAAKTEPYPGRWTTHLVIGEPDDIDDELLGWVTEAYEFAQAK